MLLNTPSVPLIFKEAGIFMVVLDEVAAELDAIHRLADSDSVEG